MEQNELFKRVAALPKSHPFNVDFQELAVDIRRKFHDSVERDDAIMQIRRHYGHSVASIKEVLAQYEKAVDEAVSSTSHSGKRNISEHDVVRFLCDQGYCQLGNKRFTVARTSQVFDAFKSWVSARRFTVEVVIGRNLFHTIMRESTQVQRLGIKKGTDANGNDVYRGVAIQEL